MVQKVNTKTLIQERLKAKKSNVTSTLSVPKPTEELKNVETLNSKNLVGEGNTPLPKEIKDQKIAEGVEKNTPGMAACIKEKIKDLIGVFTVPFGIPSLDQFKVPDLGDAKNLSIKDAFKATFEDIKNTAKDTVKGIKEAFTIKKQNGLDQVETGGLSLKKMLGCEEVPTEFTPRERKDFAEKPETVEKIEKESVKKSQVALATQADENVKQRTEPPAEKSKQKEVPTNTEVEETPPLPWNYYSIRVYKTPNSEDVEIGTLNALVDAGVGIIDSFEKITDPEEFVISVVNDVMDQNYKYVYDIVSEKDQNPEIAKFNVEEREKKENAIGDLPGGYLIVTLVINNVSYSIDTVLGFKNSYTNYIITSTYKRPGERLPTVPINSLIDFRGLGEDTYIQADQQSVDAVFKGKNGQNKFTSEIKNGEMTINLDFK